MFCLFTVKNPCPRRRGTLRPPSGAFSNTFQSPGDGKFCLGAEYHEYTRNHAAADFHRIILFLNYSRCTLHTLTFSHEGV